MADMPSKTPKRARAANPATKAVSTRKPPNAATPASAAKPADTKAAAPRKPRKAAGTAPAPVASKPKRAPRRTIVPEPAVAPAPVAIVKRPGPAKVDPAPKVGGLMAALGTLAAIGGALYVWRSSRAGEPVHRVAESDGAIEVRAYPAMVTAATLNRGVRAKALNDGFRTLADYIFAKSRPGKKIAMTAPVLSDGDATGGWRTRFIMPGNVARAALPTSPAGVEIASEPARRVAAISFSGRADDATLSAKESILRSWLQTKSLPHEGKAVHAFYNAPFLPGPLRRNEVMIVLSEEGGVSA